ncbi:MAG TPA: RES domain-containing protein [Methylomirabilota bacterium]|nr:RES domain-containing protein [Methylomirabilota bacterium]
MTPLPGALGGGALVGWRLDQDRFAATWDLGEGAYRFGGRWNSPGVRAVYCAVDPSTAILEVAVHKGFPVLDTVPHVMTSFTVAAASDAHVVSAEDVPNPNWLLPGLPSAGQQQFGDALLEAHRFVLIPSVVSRWSWNLLFAAGPATAGGYTLRRQDRFGLDTRLHPTSRPTR